MPLALETKAALVTSVEHLLFVAISKALKVVLFVLLLGVQNYDDFGKRGYDHT